MSEQDEGDRGAPQGGGSAPVPMTNLPPAVLALGGLLVAIHIAKTLVLDSNASTFLYTWFGFIPDRLTNPELVPGGALPLVWTVVTHALLHGDWMHLFFNVAWLAVFGTPVTRRYGIGGFAILGLAGAIAGAAGFAVFNTVFGAILIGASGAISGYMGAAMRFVFQPVQVAVHPETGERIVLGRKLASLREVIQNRRALAFSGIWIAINLAVGLASLFSEGGGYIAWQAHLAGFAAGFLLVPLLERRPAAQ